MPNTLPKDALLTFSETSQTVVRAALNAGWTGRVVDGMAVLESPGGATVTVQPMPGHEQAQAVAREASRKQRARQADTYGRGYHADMYECVACHVAFDTSAMLTAHMTNGHQIYRCPECPKVYASQPGLTYHLSKPHPAPPPPPVEDEVTALTRMIAEAFEIIDDLETELAEYRPTP